MEPGLPSLELLQMQRSMSAVPEEESRGIAETLARGVVGVPSAFVDTLGSSLGLIDEGDVSSFFESIGATEQASYQRQNAGALGTIGDLVGAFVPGGLGIKALRLSSSALTGTRIAESGAARLLLLNKAKQSTALRSLQRTALEETKKTSIFAKEINQGPVKFVAAKFRNVSIANAVRESIAADLAITATMNKSETLFGEDPELSDYLASAALGIGVSGAFAAIIQRSVTKRTILKAFQKHSDLGLKKLDPFEAGKQLAEGTYPGASIPIFSATIKHLETLVAQETKNPDNTLLKNLTGDLRQFKEVIQNSIVRLTQPSEAVGTVNAGFRRANFSNTELANLRQLSVDSPDIFAGAEQLFRATDFDLPTWTNKLKAKIQETDDLIEKAKLKIEEGKLDRVPQKLYDEKTRLSTLETYNFQTVNSKGEITPTAQTGYRASAKAGEVVAGRSLGGFYIKGHKQTVFIDKNLQTRFDMAEGTNPGLKEYSDLQHIGGQVIERLLKDPTEFLPKVGDRFSYNYLGSFLSDDLFLTAYEKFAAKNGIAAADNIFHFGKNWNLRKIELNSLEKKYRVFKKTYDAASKNNLNLPVLDMMHMLNLPSGPAGTLHPIMELFLSQAALGKSAKLFRKDLDDTTFAGLQSTLNQLNKNFSTDLIASQEFKLRGSGFEPNKFADFVTMKAPIPISDITINNMQNLSASRKAIRLESMADFVSKNPAGLIGSTLGSLLSTVGETSTGLASRTPYQVATAVQELTPESIPSVGALTSVQNITRYSPVLQAVSAIASQAERTTKAVMGKIFEPYVPIFSKFRADPASIIDFNIFKQAYDFGFDISKEVIEVAEGRFAYTLKNSKRNRELIGRFFPNAGEEIYQRLEAKKLELPNMLTATKQYTPVTVSTLARDAIQGLSDLTVKRGQEANAFAELSGGKKIQLRDFHLMQPAFENRAVAFTYDTVRGDIIGTYQGVSANAAMEAAKFAVKNKPGLIVLSLKDIQQNAKLYDQAVDAFVDYSDPFLNPGGSISGRGARGSIDTTAATFNGIVDQIENTMLRDGRKAQEFFFRDQLDYVRLAEAASGSSNANFRTVQETNTFDLYQKLVSGVSLLQPGTATGKAYKAFEDVIDGGLAYLHDKYFGLLSKGKKANVPEIYEKYAASREGFNPFANALEFAESVHNIKTPPEIRKISAQIASMTTRLILRFYDLAHPMVNIVSLASTMPATRYGLNYNPSIHGSKERWLESIGLYGVPIGKAENIQMPSASKMLANTFRAAMTGEYSGLLKKAVDLGLTAQNITEFSEAIGKLETATAKGALGRAWDKFLDAGSYLADHSEIFSRKLAMIQGFEIAKKFAGLEDETAILLFANKHANDIVGDYRPINKPQVFQGAAGIQLGLFQTYMFNYFRRVFSYVEDKNTRALVTQFATQAAVFGGSTVPGFNQFNEYFYAGDYGEGNFVDHLTKSFGSDGAEFLLQGTISNLPKLFSADGVSLTSRGDANIRNVPGLSGLQQLPSFSAFKTILQGIGQISDMYQDGGIPSAQRAMEVVANYSVNRPIRGILEIAAGESTDRLGQIIEDNVRKPMSIVSRVLSMRTTQETAVREAYYTNRSIQAAQDDAASRARLSLRAAARAGKLNSQTFYSALGDYVKRGGDPENFLSLLIEQQRVGTISRTTLALKDAISGRDWDQFSRLMLVLGDK